MEPGRVVGYWLLETPLQAVASDVRFFLTVYFPDSAALFIVGTLLGTLNTLRGGVLCLWFALVFAMTSQFVDVSVLAKAIKALFINDWVSFLRFLSFSCLTYGALGLGLLCGRRFLYAPHRPVGTCRKCGYDLRELPEPRCPECGTAF